MHTQVIHGVRHGSVLGPILFTWYMLLLTSSTSSERTTQHCYADDTELYISMKPDGSYHLVQLQECLKNMKAWMTQNFLLLNSDKSCNDPKHLRETLSDQRVTLDGISLAPSSTVRNLGVMFDHDMSCDPHINKSLGQLYLCNILKIRSILFQKDAEKLVHAFVTSRLDYCNSVLSGRPSKSVKMVCLFSFLVLMTTQSALQ